MNTPTNASAAKATPGRFVFEALGVSKFFPGVKALDNVTLQLTPGSIHALLGENGAGKSTLIKIITGLYKPDKGRVVIDGVAHTMNSPLEATTFGIGAVHQERNVIPDFTIGENIMLQHPPKKRRLIDYDTMMEEAAKYLAMLDLDLDPRGKVSHLSVAQVQLIEIAKALSTESHVLLLDEPTASITPDESKRLFKVMDRLRDQGTAMVLVSHKLDEVFRICDTVTVLRDGQVVAQGEPLESVGHDDVVNMMVGRTHQTEDLPPRPAPREGTPKLELRNLATRFGHRDVSFTLRSGEILGLYGLVGAGRSELARALLGLDEVVGGEVLVDGEPSHIGGVGEALHKYRIGYVTENRKEEGVFLEQSITNNTVVTLWARLAGKFGYVKRSDEDVVVDKYIDELGIRVASRHQLAGQLSGGNQQKVSLAKWLAAECDLLIIDEPTVGIDVRTKGAFHKLISELAAEGRAILLISSDLPEMITLADRVAVMLDGKIVGQLDNSGDYDAMSQSIISLIHARPADRPAP